MTTKNPSSLDSEEYIKAQLDPNWLLNLAFQMGPNCNTNCFHCYGNYGPHRHGLPSKTLAERVAEQLGDAGMAEVVLTDGEPIRKENRDVLGVFAGSASKFPVAIMTNALFANTRDEALDWFRFLRNSGWVPEESVMGCMNRLAVSAGVMYKTPIQNYGNLVSAFADTFGDKVVYYNLYFEDYWSGNEKRDMGRIEDIMKNIGGTLGVKKVVAKPHGKSPADALINFDRRTKVVVHRSYFQPQGRALGCAKYINKYFPLKKPKIKDIGFIPDTYGAIVISSSGDVSSGTSLSCLAEGRKYGNVLQEPLLDIKKRIYRDPIYQAFRLGGVRFLAHLSSEVDPTFSTEGRIHCDICYSVFGNVPRLGQVRSGLQSVGVVPAYKEYLGRLGLPRIIEFGN